MIRFEGRHFHRTHKFYNIMLWEYTTRELIVIFEYHAADNNPWCSNLRSMLLHELKLRKQMLDLTYIWS